MTGGVDLLITGFGPFPGIPVNPSATLAQRIADDRRLKRAGLSVAVRLIPTEYAAAEALIPAMVATLRPRAVLMLGVASKRKALSVELFARNRRSLLHADAAGKRPARQVVAPFGPRVLKGRAPMVPVVIAAQRAGMPTRLSRSAGSYLCNDGYWRMLAATAGPCLFLHIPKVKGRAMMLRLTDASVAVARLLARR